MLNPLMNAIGNVGLAGSGQMASSGPSILTNTTLPHPGSWASNQPITATQNTILSHQWPINTAHFQVEKVDNGFVLRSGTKIKICKDVDELKDFFVSIMVEYQLDK